MKPAATLVNTIYGSVVAQAVLIDTLHAGVQQIWRLIVIGRVAVIY